MTNRAIGFAVIGLMMLASFWLGVRIGRRSASHAGELASTTDTPAGYAFGPFDAKLYLMEMRRARGRAVRVEVYWMPAASKPVWGHIRNLTVLP